MEKKRKKKEKKREKKKIFWWCSCAHFYVTKMINGILIKGGNLLVGEVWKKGKKRGKNTILPLLLRGETLLPKKLHSHFHFYLHLSHAKNVTILLLYIISCSP